jgi:predicted transposase YdaD
MKTDIFFYKLLEMQPSIILRLAGLHDVLTVPYRFQSVELKEKSQRTDGVLIPEGESAESAPVIVCEVQFWADRFIYTRLVSETALLQMQMPEYTRLGLTKKRCCRARG